MKTKAVIFDKDGTLMDFDAFWLPVTEKVIRDIFYEVKAEGGYAEEIWKALGVNDQITDITGALCSGTYGEIGEKIYKVLKAHGCDRTPEEITGLTVEAYHQNTGEGVIKPVCRDIAGVLKRLKEMGLKLAVVTTDDAFVTKKCLDELGITGYFDTVYTDDGVMPAKPDPYCIADYCRKEEFSLSEIVMVGDTLTDMRFAQNGGIASVGVAKGERNREILKAYTGNVIPDISFLADVLK